MKKRSYFLILSMFLTMTLMAQQLTYRFANPRILRVSGVERLEFEVQAKANITGTYLWAAQVKLNFSNTTFYTTVGTNWLVTLNSALTFLNEAGNPAYGKSVNMVTGTPYTLTIGVLGDNNIVGLSNMPDPLDVVEMPTSWFMLFKVSAKLQVTTGDALAGINFLETGMNGFQQYITGPNTLVTYYNPNLYDPANFTNSYTGRLFSTLYGWSQIGNTSNAQWVNWNNNVSTSVWEGSATITQLDQTAGLIKNLRIENGSTLTINNNKWVTVSNTTTNTGTAANFVINSGGSFIPQGTVTGNLTDNRDIVGWTSATDGWHMLSSPVSNQTIVPNFGVLPPNTDPNYDFYLWDETQDLWRNQKLTSNNINSFISGTGYLVAYSTTGTRSFTGPPNTANIPLTIGYTASATYRGWNLIGNPYQSAVTWGDANWSLGANIQSIAKVWNSGSTYTDVAVGGIIPAMNGFFVKADAATLNTLTIPTASRVHSTTPWYKNENTMTDRIKLTSAATTNNTYVEAVVGFDPNSTSGYDLDFDSEFFPGNAQAPQMYSVSAGPRDLSTNVLPPVPANNTVPVAFIKGSATSYVMTATELENFMPEVSVTLEDLKLAVTQDLRQNPVYAYTSLNGDDPNRFLLHFWGGALSVNEPKDNLAIRIYSYEDFIYIVSNKNIQNGKIIVYNLMGQQILNQSLENQTLNKIRVNATEGYYGVKVVTDSETVAGKVYVK
jgi:hypothetical protein